MILACDLKNILKDCLLLTGHPMHSFRDLLPISEKESMHSENTIRFLSYIVAYEHTVIIPF